MTEGGLSIADVFRELTTAIRESNERIVQQVAAVVTQSAVTNQKLQEVKDEIVSSRASDEKKVLRLESRISDLEKALGVREKVLYGLVVVLIGALLAMVGIKFSAPSVVGVSPAKAAMLEPLDTDSGPLPHP